MYDVFDVDEVVCLLPAKNYGSSSFFEAFQKGSNCSPIFVLSINIAIPRNVETGKLEYNDIVAFGFAISVMSGREKEIYRAREKSS